MARTLVHHLRRVLGVLGIALLAFLTIFTLITEVAPITGRQLFVIGGGSMEPTIPLGALVADVPVDVSNIVVGDVVTLRADNGVVITHRVLEVTTQDGSLAFQVKGDANATADQALVPARAIVGRVSEVVPFAGYLRSFLASPAGIVAALALVGLLLLLSRLLGYVVPETPVCRPDVIAARLESISQ